MTSTITKILYDTFDKIRDKKDLNSLYMFINILEEEQYKFDLIFDNNKKRRHTVKLYNEELKGFNKKTIYKINKKRYSL